MKDLIEVLEISVQLNGAGQNMTIGHFLNICKMVQRRRDDKIEAEFAMLVQQALDKKFKTKRK